MKQKHLWYLAAVAGLFLMCQGCRKQAQLYYSTALDACAPETEGAEAARQEGLAEEASQAGSGENEIQAETACVYVCGAVEHPGLYELPRDARIGDAVEAAGGMTEEADETYLNLAEHLTDGQKIEVPTEDEAEQLLEKEQQRRSSLVDLNTATAEELMGLTGIGEAKARDILEYREQHGAFQTIEELMEIPGIKEGVFQKIKGQITV